MTENSDIQYHYMDLLKDEIARRAAVLGRPLTFCVVTFGCQMNARDSEKLAGILIYIGMTRTGSENADLVIYNTCTVRENANQKVYGRLGVLNGYKKKNPNMLIALCGCMMQEKVVTDKLRESYPFVDLVFGTHNLYRFAELLYETLTRTDGRTLFRIEEEDTAIVEELPTERTYSFKSGINIMFGCNNFCSYCIVPYVRGREKSRESTDIIKEACDLSESGVSEIMLLGQNVNSYGKGLSEDISFAKLLRMVCDIDGIKRVRFMTSHPKDLSDELIDTMASEPKICKHMHLPLQSGSDRLLNDMNRQYTRERYLSLCEKLKAAMPDITITTDIIVGYPGETEDDFLDTMDIVERVRFDSAFTFEYSKRTGTPAANRPDQVDAAVVKNRFDRLLKRVRTIGEEQAARFTGTKQVVLVEQINRQDEKLVTGRMDNNSVVHLNGDESMIGEYVPVLLKECKGFYYFGEILS